MIEKLAPTIGLEPMTGLRTDDNAEPSATQPTSDDVSTPALERPAQGNDHPTSSQLGRLGDRLVTKWRCLGANDQRDSNPCFPAASMARFKVKALRQRSSNPRKGRKSGPCFRAADCGV